MSRLFLLILILSFALTGVALASARGQAMMGERVVLCSGQPVVVTLGPDGQPIEGPAYCPDMAFALLAALAVPGVNLRQPGDEARLGFMTRQPKAEGLDGPRSQARAPPRRALA